MKDGTNTMRTGKTQETTETKQEKSLNQSSNLHPKGDQTKMIMMVIEQVRKIGSLKDKAAVKAKI